MNKYRETGILKFDKEDIFLVAIFGLPSVIGIFSAFNFIDETIGLIITVSLVSILAVCLTAIKINKKHYVYLSYSHKDKENVKRIKEAIERRLRKNAIQSFIILTDDAISVGDNVIEAITSFIKRSERVVVFISRSYLESEYCQKELSLCMNGSTKNVIPVILDSPDIISDLPEELKNIKAVVLDKSPIESEKEIDKIVDALIKK